MKFKKQTKMKNLITFAVLLVLVCAAYTGIAQSLAPPPPPPPPTPVPIDGGLSLVIAGCVGYGAKKLNDRRKANKVE
jgi:hypothetical protein